MIIKNKKFGINLFLILIYFMLINLELSLIYIILVEKI